MRIKPEIKNLIEEFLASDLKARTEIETIILYGSHALGRATTRSDIDLCYIGSFPAFKREVIAYQGMEFQLMIGPWSWYEDVISSYERKEENIGTVTGMLAQGICIYGESIRWKTLSALAHQYFLIGPNPLTERQISRIRMRITGLFDNYCDQCSNTAEQAWLAFYVVQCCIESQFKLRNWWAVKPKYELDELTQKDAAMAELVGHCIKSKGADKASLSSLCRHVLGPAGGFFRESGLVYDEAVKKNL